MDRRRGTRANGDGLRDAAGRTRRSARSGLTPREHGVLELLATGGGYAEIGRSLEIELNTVRTHVRALYEKLGVQNRAEAVNLGWSLGLLRPRRPSDAP